MFVGLGLSTGREGTARGAEGRREKAKNDQQRTDAREETVLSGAHAYIVPVLRQRGSRFDLEQRQQLISDGGVQVEVGDHVVEDGFGFVALGLGVLDGFA